MYRFTVIKNDKTVYIDEDVLHNVDLSSLPNNIHAIQWKHGSGQIEYNDVTPVSYFTSLEPYENLIAYAQNQISLIKNPPTPEPTKENLIDAAGTKRRIINNGGTAFNIGNRNIPIWVDDQSRNSLANLVILSDLEPNVTVEWKGFDGNFYTLNAQEIKDLFLALLNFIQSTFEAEKEIINLINSGSITTFAEIEGYNWPFSATLDVV